MRDRGVSPMAWFVFSLVLLSAVAGEDRSYRENSATDQRPHQPGGGSVDDAIVQLARMGRARCPRSRQPWHTASPWQANLIRRWMPSRSPSRAIVQHFAVYDASAEVRDACEDLLQRWAAARDGRAAPSAASR